MLSRSSNLLALIQMLRIYSLIYGRWTTWNLTIAISDNKIGAQELFRTFFQKSIIMSRVWETSFCNRRVGVKNPVHPIHSMQINAGPLHQGYLNDEHWQNKVGKPACLSEFAGLHSFPVYDLYIPLRPGAVSLSSQMVRTFYMWLKASVRWSCVTVSDWPDCLI